MMPLSARAAAAPLCALAETGEGAASAVGMRLDRSLSIHLVHPIVRVLNGHRQPRIPILMYHGINDGVGARHPYFETATSPSVFEGHMQFLSQNGYKTVTVSEAVEAIASGRTLSKCAAITFDDGYRDFYTHAFPVLQRHGFNATMFIVSGYTTEQGVRRDGKEFMTWNNIREIHSQGIQIGSHTITHPQLYDTVPATMETEIRESKWALEDKLGAPVSSFAYPYAFPEQDRKFARTLRESLRRNGYECGVSTIIGTAQRGDDPFFLPRIPVNSHDDLRFFDVKLKGGYDWLHSLQYLRKCAKFNHASQP